jgi:large subunit ribosomal protein L24
MRIRKDDTVEVLTGDERGARAKVISIDRPNGKILLEGVNRVYKHMRRSKKNPQGGRLSKEMPINVSNVALVCPSCGAKTRIGARTTAGGAKERFCRKCNASLGQISPERSKA